MDFFFFLVRVNFCFLETQSVLFTECRGTVSFSFKVTTLTESNRYILGVSERYVDSFERRVYGGKTNEYDLVLTVDGEPVNWWLNSLHFVFSYVES